MASERGIQEGLEEIERQQTTDYSTTKTNGAVMGMAIAAGVGFILGRKYLQK